MNGPAISVIVPAYNKVENLARCLDSLLSQTMGDFEAICVDDCSSDSSFDVIESYARADRRIKAFRHESNKGVGDARNTGIANASGRYITFVDADDALRASALEKALRKGDATDADVVVYDLEFRRPGDSAKTQSGPTSLFMSYLPPDHEDPFDCQSAGNMAFLFTGASACTKLFRRELIEDLDLRFTDHRIAEDLLFTYTALAHASRVAAVEEPLYVYDLGTGSGNGVDPGNIGILTDVFTVFRERLSSADLLEGYRNAFANLAFGHYDNMLQAATNADSLKCVFDAISEWLRESGNSFLREGGIEFANDNYRDAFRTALAGDFDEYLVCRFDSALRELASTRKTIDDLRRQLETSNAQAEIATAEAEALRSSSSYKVGNLLMRVPSKAKRAIKKS